MNAIFIEDYSLDNLLQLDEDVLIFIQIKLSK